jgi:hypothetical protein
MATMTKAPKLSTVVSHYEWIEAASSFLRRKRNLRGCVTNSADSAANCRGKRSRRMTYLKGPAARRHLAIYLIAGQLQVPGLPLFARDGNLWIKNSG